MNQPSPGVSLALDFSREPLRLARSRGALYGLFAVSLVGAASAPYFLVQRPAPEKQGKQVMEPPLDQTSLSLKIAPANGPESSRPPLNETGLKEAALRDAALSGRQLLASETTAQREGTLGPQATAGVQRDSAVRKPLVAASFKPRPMAALLPEPAAYVARQLPSPMPDSALPMLASPSPAAFAQPERVALEPLPKPEPQAGTKESFSIQIETTAVDQTAHAAPATAFPHDTIDLGALQSGGVAHDQMLEALTAPEENETRVLASALENGKARVVDDDEARVVEAVPEDDKVEVVAAAHEDDKAQVVAAVTGNDKVEVAAAMPEDENANVIVAAASLRKSPIPVPSAEPLLMPVPAASEAVQRGQGVQAGPEEEEVVVVVAADSRLTPLPERDVRIARSGDLVVVAAASSSGEEPAKLEAELRGLSLALSTRLGASAATLARAPELPKWAVMGEGKKLRLSR